MKFQFLNVEIDNKTNLKLQMLVRDAGLAVIAFHNKATGGFCRLPLEDHGNPEFQAFIEDAPKYGFEPIAVIALMKQPDLDGHPRVEFEPMPDTPEADIEKAKALWVNSLIADGVLKPDLQEN